MHGYIMQLCKCNISFLLSTAYFVVAPYIIGTDSLLCSHPSLVVASANPTAFCKIQGMSVYVHIAL